MMTALPDREALEAAIRRDRPTWKSSDTSGGRLWYEGTPAHPRLFVRRTGAILVHHDEGTSRMSLAEALEYVGAGSAEADAAQHIFPWTKTPDPDSEPSCNCDDSQEALVMVVQLRRELADALADADQLCIGSDRLRATLAQANARASAAEAREREAVAHQMSLRLVAILRQRAAETHELRQRWQDLCRRLPNPDSADVLMGLSSLLGCLVDAHNRGQHIEVGKCATEMTEMIARAQRESTRELSAGLEAIACLRRILADVREAPDVVPYELATLTIERDAERTLASIEKRLAPTE